MINDVSFFIATKADAGDISKKLKKTSKRKKRGQTVAMNWNKHKTAFAYHGDVCTEKKKESGERSGQAAIALTHHL
jgi:hypothetical protein